MLRGSQKKAFTLLELISVLAILAVVLTISAPSLGGFFKSRSLHEESRRLLALTRYARSEAVSGSVPVEVWIQTNTGEYGLQRGVTYSSKEKPPPEYQLPENQYFELDTEQLDSEGKAIIAFEPDGSMHVENPDEIIIAEDENKRVVIKKSNFGMGYIIDEGEEDE